MAKETCKECPPKVKKFCRSHGVAMNSKVCDAAQKDIKEATFLTKAAAFWSGRKAI
jgi:hypothetical protein